MKTVKIALPKGRLGEKIYRLFARSGYGCADYCAESRKLIFAGEGGVTFFWVKPSDVAVYVERGAADLGVAGKDVLDEYEPDVYELCDFPAGRCSMCVAAPHGFVDDTARPLKVATKYPRSAERYYLSRGREITLIKLHGSIELAPIVGLSDVIFDIVETGSTLRENDLEVISYAAEISARLIVNKSAYKFNSDRIEEIVKGLKGGT